MIPTSCAFAFVNVNVTSRINIARVMNLLFYAFDDWRRHSRRLERNPRVRSTQAGQFDSLVFGVSLCILDAVFCSGPHAARVERIEFLGVSAVVFGIQEGALIVLPKRSGRPGRTDKFYRQPSRSRISSLYEPNKYHPSYSGFLRNSA